MGWVGGNIHGIRKRKLYHGTRPFRVEGGANIHGIRKEKFYHGTGPFRVGGTFMESDPLGSGRGEHSWNQEEIVLTWDTIL